MPGYLIAFEGGDGAGKSTQARLLAEWLRDDQGHDVVLTREPGRHPAGGPAPRACCSRRDDGSTPRTEALLFAADRADHVADRRAAGDASGARSSSPTGTSTPPSPTRAPGATSDGDEIAQLSRWATDGLVPDLTVLLDIPQEFARVRRAGDAARAGEDRLEALPAEFHERVRDRFLELARAEPARYLVLDGTVPREADPGADPPPGARRAAAVGPPARASWRSGSPRRRPRGAAGRRPRPRCCAWTPNCAVRQRDESRAREQTRRRLREEAERQLAEEAERRSPATPPPTDASSRHRGHPASVPTPAAGTAPRPRRRTRRGTLRVTAARETRRP